MKIKDKKKCCGCGACTLVCPENCLRMEEDQEGFLYPSLNESRCTDCGLCYHVCPISKNVPLPEDRVQLPKAFAVWNKDDLIRLKSSSGGVFTALSEELLKQGGYVAGAVFDEDHTVCHVLTNDRSQLENLRRSKYIQSRTGNLYLKIGRILSEKRKVLMCGTPCQIRGLYGFLGNDSPDLMTSEFICHGVNSPKVFLKYLKDLEQQFSSKAVAVDFRDKSKGWHLYSIRILFENGTAYVKEYTKDPFMRMFLQKDIFVRPCCYDCQFKDQPRQADITIADFWGIEDISPETDDDRGISLVLLNSQKGADLFDRIKEKVVVQSFDLSAATAKNPSFTQSVVCPKDRDLFFCDLKQMNFFELSGKYVPIPESPSLLKRFQKYIKHKMKEMCSFHL